MRDQALYSPRLQEYCLTVRSGRMIRPAIGPESANVNRSFPTHFPMHGPARAFAGSRRGGCPGLRVVAHGSCLPLPMRPEQRCPPRAPSAAESRRFDARATGTAAQPCPDVKAPCPRTSGRTPKRRSPAGPRVRAMPEREMNPVPGNGAAGGTRRPGPKQARPAGAGRRGRLPTDGPLRSTRAAKHAEKNRPGAPPLDPMR